MNDKADILKDRIKRQFISEYVDNWSKPELYGVNDQGEFLLSFEFTHEQMAFLILHFDSEEEVKESIFAEVKKRIDAKS